MRITRLYRAAAAAWLVLLAAGGAAARAEPHVINQGTRQWADAARFSRADMLILGDSNVWHSGHGWDAGFINAAHNRFGLTGTGLHTDGSFNGAGEGYSTSGGPANGWDTSEAAVPAPLQGHVWHGVANTAGATPRSNFGFSVTGSNLPTDANYEWHLYTTAPPGGGSMTAYRRLGSPPFTRLQTLGPIPTRPATVPLGASAVRFDVPTSGGAQEFFLENTTDTSVLYSRLVPLVNSTGVTVTSWGYGGRSTLDFLNDQYVNGMSAAGRRDLLSAVVHSGAGKLNVVIAEGLNDRAETSPSASGITPGNSPAAFEDNMRALISAVRADWVAGGHAPQDLSFTLLGSFQDGFATRDPSDPLRQFAAREAAIARSDPQVSFIDVFELAPTYQEAVAAGYMFDESHLSRLGSLTYSLRVMDQLAVPEPVGLCWAAALGLPLWCGRRWRRRARVATAA